jgi:PIN domain nuclease of toxin-antitoxin system
MRRIAYCLLLPSICLVEIVYLAEKNRLEPAVLSRLFEELNRADTTLMLAPLDLGVVLALQDIPGVPFRTLPDRVIAATAPHYCVPLVTRDCMIHVSGIKTVW